MFSSLFHLLQIIWSQHLTVLYVVLLSKTFSPYPTSLLCWTKIYFSKSGQLTKQSVWSLWLSQVSVIRYTVCLKNIRFIIKLMAKVPDITVPGTNLSEHHYKYLARRGYLTADYWYIWICWFLIMPNQIFLHLIATNPSSNRTNLLSPGSILSQNHEALLYHSEFIHIPTDSDHKLGWLTHKETLNKKENPCSESRALLPQSNKLLCWGRKVRRLKITPLSLS